MVSGWALFHDSNNSSKLQVDNGIKIFHYNGSLYFKKMFNKLYQVDWKPESPSKFVDITELIKSLDLGKVEDKKPSGQGPKTAQASTKASSANPLPQKPAAYRPRHAKTAAAIQAELLGESTGESLSKNALRNKKKREKKAASDASAS